MIKNLDTADRIVRVTVAALIIVLHGIGEIDGPLAHMLFGLALLMIAISLIRKVVSLKEKGKGRLKSLKSSSK